jgi:hypothetical protein
MLLLYTFDGERAIAAFAGSVSSALLQALEIRRKANDKHEMEVRLILDALRRRTSTATHAVLFSQRQIYLHRQPFI